MDLVDTQLRGVRNDARTATHPNLRALTDAVINLPAALLVVASVHQLRTKHTNRHGCTPAASSVVLSCADGPYSCSGGICASSRYHALTKRGLLSWLAWNLHCYLRLHAHAC